MNEYSPVARSAEMQAESDAMKQAASKSLALRRASGEILLYELAGWMLHEHPGGRIERLAPLGQFRAADFPYPKVAPSSE